MDNIWYLYDDSKKSWQNLLYLPERSSLNDIFEYLDEYKDKTEIIKYKQTGIFLDMYYGTMEKLIKNGLLKRK